MRICGSPTSPSITIRSSCSPGAPTRRRHPAGCGRHQPGESSPRADRSGGGHARHDQPGPIRARARRGEPDAGLPALGLPTDRPAARIAETIDVCRRLLRGEEVSVSGPTLSLAEVRLDVGDLPEIPIFVGAGDRASCGWPEPWRTASSWRRCARRRDSTTRWERWREAPATRGGLRRRSRSCPGKRSSSRRRSPRRTMRGIEPGPRRSCAARGKTYSSGSGSRPTTIRSVSRCLPGVRERAAGSLVPDGVVSRLLLVGDPEQILERVQTVRARGIDSLSIISFGTTEVVQDTLRRFALDVMDRSAR